MATRLTQPARLGSLILQNRIVMAPMTRSRAEGNIPNSLIRDYYAQRASAGLIISEGTAPSPDGLGYARIPGLYTEAQARAWREVVQAVHAGGAKFFVQLMHVGRIGHPANLPAGARLVAPSAIAAAGQIWTDSAGMQAHPVPKAMDAADLAAARDSFVASATLAVEHGVDGVELHAANGYLLAQFLNPRSNQRTDAYGGSGENRRRFLLETVDATIAAIGKDRVGVRLSPFNPFNDLEANFEGEREEFLATVAELAQRGIAYLHLGGGTVPADLLPAVRKGFPGSLILNGGYDGARAEADVAAGLADLVAFGRPFVSNPDLPERLRTGAPIADLDAATLYTPGAVGFTDYPRLDAVEAAVAT
jgi:N-ethylmaleimide reductase